MRAESALEEQGGGFLPPALGLPRLVGATPSLKELVEGVAGHYLEEVSDATRFEKHPEKMA